MNQKIHTNELLKMCDKLQNIKKKNWEIIEKTETKIEQHEQLVNQYSEQEYQLFKQYCQEDITTAKKYSKIYQAKLRAENKKDYHWRRLLKLRSDVIEMKAKYE